MAGFSQGRLLLPQDALHRHTICTVVNARSAVTNKSLKPIKKLKTGKLVGRNKKCARRLIFTCFLAGWTALGHLD
jgi:hypothetical protein